MSTTRTRDALERLAELEGGSTPVVLAALLEVEAIEKAAKTLTVSVATTPEDHRAVELLCRIAEEAP